MINNKKAFIIFTLMVLLLGISAISATDSNDTTNIAVDDGCVSIQTEEVIDTPTIENDELISNDNNINNNEKEEITRTELTQQFIDSSNFASTFTDGGSYSDTEFIFSGSFNNLGSYNFNLNNVVFTSNDFDSAIFTDTTFNLQGTNYNITKLTFDNADSLDNSAITVIDSTYVNIKLNDILYNKASGEVHGISVLRSSYINVTNNSVDIYGSPQSMGWNNDSGVYSGAVAVSGIVVGNSPYVNVTNNTITVQNNSIGLSGYTTNEGLTIKNPNTNNIMAINNTINVTGAQYNYGTTISDYASNIVIHNNTFNMTGALYNCGIQFDNSGSSDITNNNIYCVSNGVTDSTISTLSYGIINTCWYKPNNQYVDIKNNYINLTANVNYGIELYLTGYSDVQNNTIRCDGIKSIGIGAYQADHTNIIENNIHANGTSGSINNVVESINPNNYGIFADGCTTTKVNDNTICEHNSGSLTDVYAIKSTTTLDELKNNEVCVNNGVMYKILPGCISATATSESGNGLYDCPICNSISHLKSSKAQTSTLFKNDNKQVKKEARSIVITADNFEDYVTDGLFNDNVNNGDTLDFQGVFYGSRFALNINKPVNIISSTNDAYICLDTTNNDFFGNEQGDSYTISRNGSGTNISGIYFNNTQLFIKNAENITLNNITVNNEDLQLGSGVGVTSIRENSSNIQVLNSYFRTKDNYGHSTLACAWANNVLIENCTIETEGMVGNLFYATTYNLVGNENVGPYTNNNITLRNNHLNGLKAQVAEICYAIALEGKGHVIENNLIEYYGSCIKPQWGYGNVSDITIRNNTIPYGTAQIGYQNTIVDNNVMNFTTLERVNATNNKFGSVNIFSNVNFTDNIVETINGINARENITIVNNFIDTLNINDNSKNYYVANNTIYSPESYAVNIKKGSQNITLENNIIASKDKNSTEAINNQTEYTSINNTGLIIYHFTDEDYLNSPYTYMDIPRHPNEVIVTLNKKYEDQYEIYIAGPIDNSILYIDFDLNYNDTANIFTLLHVMNHPKEIIINSSKLNHITFRQIKSSYTYNKTTLVKDSYLPELKNLQVVGRSDVDIPYKFADNIMGNFKNIAVSLDYRFYNNTILDSYNNTTDEVLNTSINTNINGIVMLNEETNIQFTVLANNTLVNDGKIVIFDNSTKYGEFEVINGIAQMTTTFNDEGNYSLIAYYMPINNSFNSSNIKFNFTVKQPIAVVNLEDITLNPTQTTSITATITTEDGSTINGGKVVFKVDGKTLKDANGKIIYAKVVDGVASINYTVADNLVGKDVEITAVFLGYNQYAKAKTSVNKTVSTPEPTLTIEPLTEDIQSNTTVTIKAKVSVSDTPITKGKMVFKINGKTLKDANGKVIYAKVDANGEVSLDYNISNFKSGTYTLEAVLTAPGYDKVTNNITINIV